MVDTLAGVQRTYEGVPESLSHAQAAYVALGGQDLTEKTTGQFQRQARYLVVFTSRVKGNEQSAERWIAGVIDTLIAVWKADRTLGGTCTSSRLDLTPADTPLYAAFAGQEHRLWPLMVIADQRDTFPTG
jgi:hypothetical protein